MELYDRPPNLFVAGFLGSPAMNFLEGNYDPRTGMFAIDGGPTFGISGAWEHTGAAILGVRPEHILPDPDGIPVVVEMAELTGAEVHLTLKLGSQSVVAAFRDRPPDGAGATLNIGFAGDRVHLFDPITRMRLELRPRSAGYDPAISHSAAPADGNGVRIDGIAGTRS